MPHLAVSVGKILLVLVRGEAECPKKEWRGMGGWCLQWTGKAVTWRHWAWGSRLFVGGFVKLRRGNGP